MAAQPADPAFPWTLVVPVKVLARAKSRLAALAGRHRPALALAMASDTVAAARACPQVAGLVVVTGDREVAQATAELGAVVVPEQPRQGLNAALLQGAAHVAAWWPGCGVGALTADLPALRPAELSLALAAAARCGQSFVADAAGSGTTLYAATTVTDFTPGFGEDSASRHRAAGAVPLALPGLDGLRRDVDSPADLRAAAELGLGERTARIAELIARDRGGNLRCGRSGR